MSAVIYQRKSTKLCNFLEFALTLDLILCVTVPNNCSSRLLGAASRISTFLAPFALVCLSSYRHAGAYYTVHNCHSAGILTRSVGSDYVVK